MDLNDALREALARESEPAYLLDRQGHLLFVNDAWDRAARAADAPETALAEQMVGSRWLDAVSGRARRYYAALLSRVFSLRQQEPPCALVHLSESNDAEHARVTVHRFLPLFTRLDESPQWVLVVHQQVSQTALSHRYPVRDADPSKPTEGMAAQCSSCRRTRFGPAVAGDGTWVMCPALIATPPPQVRFGLCRACRQRYYVRPQEQPLQGARAARLPRSAGLWLSARLLPVSVVP